MTSGTETGGVTGTPDKDYNLIWYVEACLSNALRLESYIQDAERGKDTEVADLFRKAQADSRKGAELGKELLRSRLTAGSRARPGRLGKRGRPGLSCVDPAPRQLAAFT
jgi:hypothetical protein